MHHLKEFPSKTSAKRALRKDEDEEYFDLESVNPALAQALKEAGEIIAERRKKKFESKPETR